MFMLCSSSVAASTELSFTISCVSTENGDDVFFPDSLAAAAKDADRSADASLVAIMLGVANGI